MFKQLTAVLLILAFMGSIFCRTAIMLDYYTNTAAYAKNCINKAKLAMHCNGKCQMMKKLEQQEKNDQDSQERKSENKNELLFTDNFNHLALALSLSTRHVTSRSTDPKPVDMSYTLLRPPAVCSLA